MNNNYNNSKINNLKTELSNAYQIIEQQNIIIKDLRNKLNNCNNTINNLNNNIINYQNIINQNNLGLNNLQFQLNNNFNNNFNNNVNFGEIMVVNFISSDSRVHYAIKCHKANTFAEIEEKLYQQYPEYRETNNNFLANDACVLRFKTIEQNKIGNGLPVTLIIPS